MKEIKNFVTEQFIVFALISIYENTVMLMKKKYLVFAGRKF
jgi:hypothetical protein